MKFLIDNSLSPALAEGLRQAGHDAVHLLEYGMQSASDDEVIKRALTEDRTIMMLDYGSFLPTFFHENQRPSVIMFDGLANPAEQQRILLRNLAGMEANLARGCLATFLRNPRKGLLYLWLPLGKGRTVKNV